MLMNCSKTNFNVLNRTYNRAIKILFSIPTLYPSHLLPQRTSVISLSSLRIYHTLIYGYLIFYNLAPTLLTSFFTTTRRKNFFLHSNSCNNSIHNAIAIEWNKLHECAKTVKTKNQFIKFVSDK